MSDKILKLSQAQTLYSDLRERIDALPTTEDIPEVPVQDVQVNDASILENGVANIPYAQNGIAGLFYSTHESGFSFNVVNGIPTVALKAATPIQIKEGTQSKRAITPSVQHTATFYALAKAAGDTTQSQSNNAVGTYTDGAKTAIQNMLDVPSNAAMTTAIGTAIGNINSFDMAVVQALPTQDISTHTIYLVPKTGETNDVYDEYVYINSNWEMVGNTQVDLSNYVQKTDYATNSIAGIVKGGSRGVMISNDGTVAIDPAISDLIKIGNNSKNPIVPAKQHESVFYGLAKVAGDTTQSQSNNAVGTYTTEAKAAIQTMLDTPSNADLALKANKTDTILETTLSRGRKANTTVGGASLAFGIDTEASGYYSVALGLNTTASSQGAFAEGKNTVAHYIAHAEGENTQALGQWAHSQGVGTVANGAASFAGGDNTIANGHASFVTGRYNAADSYDNWPTWTANTSYEVGDRVKRNLMVQNEPTDVGYHCTVANSDATFDIAHWELDGYHMNYVEIVGNGNEYEDPETHQMVRAGSNAYALEWNGTAHYAGDVYVGANPDSTGGEKLAKVSDIPVERGTGVGSIKTKDFEYNDIYFANIAAGLGSFAEGTYNLAAGDCSHAEGACSVASGMYAHAEGYHFAGTIYLTGEENSTAYNYAATSVAIEEGCYITDKQEYYSKILSVDRTNNSIVVSKTYGQACDNVAFTCIDGRASGSTSHAEGMRTKADGMSSHAEGLVTVASERGSHAEGEYSQATGKSSHSEGGYTKASKSYSHAEGFNAIASGNVSHAEGNYTIAEASASHAEGQKTIAKGAYSHVEGRYNVEDSYDGFPEWTSSTSYEVGDKVKITEVTNGETSVKGYICKMANSDASFVSSNWGSYPAMNYAHIVGNGTADDARSNAFALDWDGTGHFMGDVYVGANADSTGGTRLATVTELAAKLDAAEAGLKVVRLI